MSIRDDDPAADAVRAVWREVLGVDNIEPGDTFTGLGGTSLQIVEVRDLLRQHFGVRLGIADLAGATTAAALGARLDAAGRAAFTRRTGAVTRVGEDTTEPRVRVFCLPGSGGSAWSFVPLAARLPAEIALYAVCQRGLERRGPAHFRMRSLVRYATRAIRAVQPTGPYVLLGHSMGAVAALEVAARLRGSGGEVALVVLLDAPLPAATARLLGEPAHAPGIAVGGAGRSAADRLRLYAAIPTAGLVRRAVGRQQELFYEIGLRVQNRHRLRAVAGPALAVVTDQTAHQLPGWRQVLGEVTVVRVAGGHMDVVREGPVLAEFADRLTAALMPG
ncbi:alpha/beta fold hydrolase [Nocardia sp. IBHARD005]|uniref:alpha/beta fold hydrolase n=1 Tax=Nocardia sp. IBHARD005 TaxID=3457765 RepID=UPI0040585B0C